MTTVSLDWRPTPTMHAMATIAMAGLVTAGLLRSGTVLALVLPELLCLAAYGRPTLPSTAAVEVTCHPARLEEDQEARAWLHVRAAHVVIVDAVCDGEAANHSESSHTGDTTTFRWIVRPQPWGHRALCRGRATLSSRGGLWQARIDLTWPVVTVLPTTSLVRSTIAAARLRGAPGGHPARLTAVSGQPAGTAPYAVGTPVRRVNWPQTLRHRALHVTTFEAERAQDVVLLVDALVEVGVAGRSSLDRAVRAAASLARAYLRGGDRVGLVVATPALSWVLPGSGEHQLAWLLDQLAGLRDRSSLLPPELDRVPPAAVPPGSQVIVLSPLLHQHSVSLTAALRRAGHPVVVLDVLARESAGQTGGHFARTAHRLWRLERAATRATLSERGILVLAWPPDQNLDGVFRSLPAGIRHGHWLGRAS